MVTTSMAKQGVDSIYSIIFGDRNIDVYSFIFNWRRKQSCKKTSVIEFRAYD